MSLDEALNRELAADRAKIADLQRRVELAEAHVENLAHDLTELANVVFRGGPKPDESQPTPKQPDPVPPASGDLRFGCNIGFNVDKPWSPDKPDAPGYTDKLRPVAKILRYMDWWKINDVLADEWNTELLGKQINLALACDSDFYLNLRFYDRPETIERKIKAVRQAIGPNKKLYVEWANEPWNLGTRVSKEIQRLSGVPHFGGGDNLRYFDVWAEHSSEAFEAAKQADPDCITVLGCLTANPWVAQQVESRMHAEPDAHGLTTYFGAGLGSTPAQDLSVNDILESASRKLDGKEIPRVVKHLQFSQSLGRQTIAYEGGPHFTLDPRLHESHKHVWRAMNDANRDPRIVDLMERMTRAWETNGGGPIVHYNFLSLYDQWGSWGLGESLDTIEQSPKYQWATGAA